jgi:hypothetical protein
MQAKQGKQGLHHLVYEGRRALFYIVKHRVPNYPDQVATQFGVYCDEGAPYAEALLLAFFADCLELENPFDPVAGKHGVFYGVGYVVGELVHRDEDFFRVIVFENGEYKIHIRRL